MSFFTLVNAEYRFTKIIILSLVLQISVLLVGCNPLGNSSKSVSSSGSGGSTPTVSSSCPSTGTAAVSDVLSGKTFPDTSGSLVTGTMTNHGAFNLTGAFTAGYVSSLTGLSASNVCSTTSLLGTAGTATCTTAATLSYTTGQVLWLKADSLSGTYSHGDTVVTWNDSSSAGHNFTGSGTPLYQKFYGISVVNFAGSEYMTTPHSADFALSDFDFFAVVRVVATDTNWWIHTILSQDAAGGGIVDKWMFSFDTAGFYFHARGYGSSINGQSNAVNLLTVNLLNVSRSGSTITYYVNGTAQGTTTYSDPLVDNGSDTVKIAYGEGAKPKFTGDIAEIIMYNSALSAGNRDTVKCYLSSKYTLGISGC